jgi:hypothetical protein
LWHLIEFDNGWSGTTVGTRVFVDGVQWASDATDTSVTTTTTADFGVMTVTTANLYFDDIAIGDDPITTALGAKYSLAMLKPTADSARSAGWFRCDGTTTTGLFNEVNIVPPAGNTSVVLGTGKHVKNAASSTTDNYDATCAAYNTVVGVYDECLAVQAVTNSSQEVTTQSPKAGAIVIASNPTGQTESSFDYGIPNGTAGSTTAAAMGTFPTGWGTNAGPVTAWPSVDITTGPVVRVGKRQATTRVVDADYMGVYLMYVPNVRKPRPPSVVTRVAGIRAGSY